MLIFIYGEDTYRSRQKTRELVDAFRKKHDPSGLNIAQIDGAKATADELGSAVNTPGFLAARRLAVIRGLLEAKRGEEEMSGQIIPLIKNHPAATIIILHDDLAEDKMKVHPLRRALAGGAKDSVIDYPFTPLDRRELVSWMQIEAKKRGVSIEPKAVELLAVMVGSDLWRLSSELDKLAAHLPAHGPAVAEPRLWRGVADKAGTGSGPILVRDVIDLVRGTVEENIFAFIDAVAARDLGRASTLLRDQLAAGLDEFYLLSMLIRQFRLLLSAHSFLEENKGASKSAMAGRLGLHPFVAGKLLAQVRNFLRSDLERFFIRLFTLERTVKTGQLAPAAALDLFVGSLASS